MDPDVRGEANSAERSISPWPGPDREDVMDAQDGVRGRIEENSKKGKYAPGK